LLVQRSTVGVRGGSADVVRISSVAGQGSVALFALRERRASICCLTDASATDASFRAPQTRSTL
jgi:hypothetical protein